MRIRLTSNDLRPAAMALLGLLLLYMPSLICVQVVFVSDHSVMRNFESC